MLTTTCIHPGIMKALSLCGHGSKVLIADGNYPLAEKSGDAEKIYLGLTPGLPTVTDVLKAVHSVVEIEKAEVMVPGDGSTPEIFAEFKEELGLDLSGVGRFEYYDVCCEPDVVLAISTGEKRVFANILLTIGCA
ncbi:MAG: RbsD or FucU transport [Lachnospiraceae bacterium]|nr:RbsD or FucU transport [Lachnospiraceae bacterium]